MNHILDLTNIFIITFCSVAHYSLARNPKLPPTKIEPVIELRTTLVIVVAESTLSAIEGTEVA
jgi:hypothetical protein